MTAEISVIVPVYNVEKYLDKCISSILRQTFDNFELLLVDDASEDRCPEICEYYAKMDKRVRVIHRKVNGGLSAARNTGIKASEGKWISFVDSDDWISDNMLKCLYESTVSSNAQIGICDFFRVYEDGKLTGESFGRFREGVFTYEDIVKKFAGDENIWYTVMFGKLFDRTLFENIRFPENKLNEDVFITLKLFRQCVRVRAVSDKLYYYVSRSDSIMHRYTVQALDGVEALYNIFNEFYTENRIELLPQIEKILFARLTVVYKGLDRRERKQPRVEDMIQYSKRCVKIIKKEHQITWLSRIRTNLFFYYPPAFFAVESLFNRIKGIRK